MYICDMPADALVEILSRLPPSARRRSRLVCRHWRAVVDQRTPEMKSRAKTLVVVNSTAHVLDVEGDPPDGGHSRVLWEWDCRGVIMVGTSNGLLCLLRPDGGIAVVNPVTGETLDVPPPWPRGQEPRYPMTSCEARFSFGYHPTTGRYKIVHFPTNGDYRDETFDAVRVFTLGAGGAWRDVPAPAGSSRCRKSGVESADGATYWFAKDTERVMSFDLEHERVAAVEPLPVPVVQDRRHSCRLTEAGGRLAVVIADGNVDCWHATRVEIQAWVLERGGRDGRGAWSRRYSVQLHGGKQRMAWPRFADGDHVLTTPTWRNSNDDGNCLFAHRLSGERGQLRCREARINDKKPGKTVFNCVKCYIETFTYVETTEPLS